MWLRKSIQFPGLKKSVRRKYGRSRGKITVRHRGGGFRYKFTSIDYGRFIWNVPAVVRGIEKHKGVGPFVATLIYSCGVVSYILAPYGIRPGHTVWAGPNAKPTLGSCLPLRNVPLNIKIHNIESRPGGGAKYARAAGTWAKVAERGSNEVVVVFKNGRRKRLHQDCSAVIGGLSNIHRRKQNVASKAGASRNAGRRPSVRGVAQNPVDHPHGGGKGKKSPKNPNYNFVRKLPKGRKTAASR